MSSSKRKVDIRYTNGIISAALACFFFVHAFFGSVSLLVFLPNKLSFLVWAGVCLMATHVAACVVTSRRMLADTDHPPSARKKGHLALKWISGGLLLASAAFHVWKFEGFASPEGDAAFLFTTLLVVGLFACHLFIGLKSLLKDMNVDRGHRTCLRFVVCILSILLAGMIVWRILESF